MPKPRLTEVAALRLAVERGLLSEAEFVEIMNTVSSSLSGGLAYTPFDVVQHVRPHPRFAEIAKLRGRCASRRK